MNVVPCMKERRGHVLGKVYLYLWYVSRLRCTRAIHTYTNHTEHIQNRHSRYGWSGHFWSLFLVFCLFSPPPPPPRQPFPLLELQVNSDPKTHRLLDDVSIIIIIFISIIIITIICSFSSPPYFPFSSRFLPPRLGCSRIQNHLPAPLVPSSPFPSTTFPTPRPFAFHLSLLGSARG